MPEIMFQDLADNAPVMIWRSGPDKLCTWFNQLWLNFTVRTMEQEAGFGWAEGVHPDDLEACLARSNQAFDAREKFSMTYRLRRHDGVYRWLLDTGAPYCKGSVFSGYFGTCIDVTEQREAHDIDQADQRRPPVRYPDQADRSQCAWRCAHPRIGPCRRRPPPWPHLSPARSLPTAGQAESG